MPLDDRKRTHIAANRTKIRQGRTEVVTLVHAQPGVTLYSTAACIFQETGNVPAGVAERSGAVVQRPWDALAEFDLAADLSTVTLLARTAGGTAEAVAVPGVAKYRLLDVVQLGLGGANRRLARLRRIKE
jgi:hypothetical protein